MAGAVVVSSPATQSEWTTLHRNVKVSRYHFVNEKAVIARARPIRTQGLQAQICGESCLIRDGRDSNLRIVNCERNAALVQMNTIPIVLTQDAVGDIIA